MRVAARSELAILAEPRSGKSGTASRGDFVSTGSVGRFKALATIWHSKLGVLCDAARQRPTELSVLLDGGLMGSPTNPLISTPLTTAEGALDRSLTQTVAVPFYAEYAGNRSLAKMEMPPLSPDLIMRDRMSLGWVETTQRESASQRGKLQTEFYFEDGQLLQARYFFGKRTCHQHASVAAGVLVGCLLSGVPIAERSRVPPGVPTWRR